MYRSPAPRSSSASHASASAQAPPSTAVAVALALAPDATSALALGRWAQRSRAADLVLATCRTSDLATAVHERGATSAVIAVDAIRRFDGGPSGLAGVALARKLGCDVTAVVPDGDVDAASAALAAGAHALVQAGALGALASDAAPSRESPAAIGSGAGPSGPPSDELPVRFRSRYGAAWADWMEPCLVVLGAGGERTEQAEALDALSGADAAPGGSQQSRRRLRRLSAVLCGEVRGNQALLSAEAIRALRLLA